MRTPAKSAARQQKPRPTSPTRYGRTTPTAIPFRGISRLKSWKTVTVTATRTNFPAITTQPTPIPPGSPRTLTTTLTACPTPTKRTRAQIQPILTRTVTACATAPTLLAACARPVPMPSRLTRRLTPTRTATACRIPSTVAPPAFHRLWRMRTTTATDLKT